MKKIKFKITLEVEYEDERMFKWGKEHKTEISEHISDALPVIYNKIKDNMFQDKSQNYII